jgi:hypothetical protein
VSSEVAASLLKRILVVRRIAAPMIGPIVTSFAMELVVYPVIYELWKWHYDIPGYGEQNSVPEC